LVLAQEPPVGQGLLFHEISRSHTTGRVISSSQRPLPDNTQSSKQTSMLPAGSKPTISAGERPQTYVSDQAATGTGKTKVIA